MARSRISTTSLFLGAAASLVTASAMPLFAQEASPKPAKLQANEGPEVAAVRKTAEEFKRAFDAGDAKAVASLWTPGGDYTEGDGEQLVGREAIEQAYAEFFQENPKATVEVSIGSVRVLGPNVAVEEGTARMRRPDDAEEAGAGRYSALHVRSEEGWKMASVTEWPSDPSLDVSLKDIEWLVGDWELASEEGTARVTYEWDEGHAFIRGRYTVRKGEGLESKGTETIARNPTGGLRSWRFDGSGAFAESSWARDGKSWLVEAAATLPDGSEAATVVLITPLDRDSFLWQTTERSAGGVALPGTRPLKVTRVGATPGAGQKTPAKP